MIFFLEADYFNSGQFHVSHSPNIYHLYTTIGFDVHLFTVLSNILLHHRFQINVPAGTSFGGWQGGICPPPLKTEMSSLCNLSSGLLFLSQQGWWSSGNVRGPSTSQYIVNSRSVKSSYLATGYINIMAEV